MDLPLAVSLRTYYPAPDPRISHHRLVLSSLDGKTRRPLTDGPFDDTDVAWVDAHTLVFLRTYTRRSRPAEVCRIDIPTGAVTVLYRSRNAANVLGAVVAPDGRHIAVRETPAHPVGDSSLDPILLLRTDRPAPAVKLGEAYFVSWTDPGHVLLTGGPEGWSVDIATRVKTRADLSERPTAPRDGRTWRMVTRESDENYLAIAGSGGRDTAVQPDAALRKALEDADRTLGHLRYLRLLSDDPVRLWVRTFDHRAMPTIHARLDPTTGAASYWFTSVGPTRATPDGKWLLTYPMEEYTPYGKGRQIATRNLLRTSLASPGAWQPLFPGLVHVDSFAFR